MRTLVYMKVIAPTAWYETQAWGMKSAERTKVNVLEMKCLRNLVGVSWMDRVKNEVRRWIVMKRELARACPIDQRALIWLRHEERMDEYRIPRRVSMVKLEGRYRVDRWCENALGHHGMTAGAVRNIGWSVYDSFPQSFLSSSRVFWTALPRSGGLSPERGWMRLG